MRTIVFKAFVLLFMLESGVVYAETTIHSSGDKIKQSPQEECDDSDLGVIVIKVPNITLNCDGAKLTGSGEGIGIYIKGSDNVTVMNCQIDNYKYGIYAEDSQNIRILNMGNKITNTTNQVVLDESTVEPTVPDRKEYVRATPTPVILPSFKLLLNRVNSKSGDLLKENAKKDRKADSVKKNENK